MVSWDSGFLSTWVGNVVGLQFYGLLRLKFRRSVGLVSSFRLLYHLLVTDLETGFRAESFGVRSCGQMCTQMLFVVLSKVVDFITV